MFECPSWVSVTLHIALSVNIVEMNVPAIVKKVTKLECCSSGRQYAIDTIGAPSGTAFARSPRRSLESVDTPSHLLMRRWPPYRTNSSRTQQYFGLKRWARSPLGSMKTSIQGDGAWNFWNTPWSMQMPDGVHFACRFYTCHYLWADWCQIADEGQTAIYLQNHGPDWRTKSDPLLSSLTKS